MTKLTEADQRLLHSYVTDGEGCWHIWDDYPEEIGQLTAQCKLCGVEKFGNHRPDYSTREHFPDLTAKLFGDFVLWSHFALWVMTEKAQSGFTWLEFLTWFLHPSRVSEFCTLFCSFLRLPEMVREFGYIECPEYIQSRHGSSAECARKGTEQCNDDCNGTGQILRPWAKLVKEEGK